MEKYLEVCFVDVEEFWEFCVCVESGGNNDGV